MVALLSTLAVPTDPLPLPVGWGVADALAALTQAVPDLPVPLPAPRVVAELSTVVLRAGDFAVKVYPPGTSAAHVSRIAAALNGSQSAVLPLTSPVTTRHGVVVVQPWAGTMDTAADWPGIGRLTRRFHDEHCQADVPAWVPARRLEAQLAYVPADLAEGLRRARHDLVAALTDVDSPLGLGLIHGDVSPSNVLATTAGLRFIDLDFVARGPREYDLAGTARRFAAGEIDAEAYDGFCDAYGYDVRFWAGTPLLDALAALAGLAFRIWDSRRRCQDLSWLPSAAAALLQSV